MKLLEISMSSYRINAHPLMFIIAVLIEVLEGPDGPDGPNSKNDSYQNVTNVLSFAGGRFCVEFREVSPSIP